MQEGIRELFLRLFARYIGVGGQGWPPSNRKSTYQGLGPTPGGALRAVVVVCGWPVGQGDGGGGRLMRNMGWAGRQ